jgi:hypothetical protein
VIFIPRRNIRNHRVTYYIQILMHFI